MRDFRRFGRAKRMRIPGFRLARESGEGSKWRWGWEERERKRERGRKSRIEW